MNPEDAELLEAAVNLARETDDPSVVAAQVASMTVMLTMFRQARRA